MSASHVYRISFLNQGQVYELYARHIGQGDMLGFVEVEDLLFGERSQVVVDPSEERLKTEFDGVHRIHVPLHAVLRIDEVEKQGASRIREGAGEEGNIAAFPTTLYTPSGDSGKS